MTAAQRPLTLEELREAVSIKPGETSWDASQLVNDMLSTLLDSCGSLVMIEEEDLSVHFVHQSVKQHLFSESTDSKYHIRMKDADLYLGDVIVTYLNYNAFDRQLTKAKSPMQPQVINYPSAILDESLPRSNIANRLAVKLLKSRRNPKLDIHSQLKKAVGIEDGSNEQTQPSHPFLPYAQEYWLFHTKLFSPARVAGYTLWEYLITEKVKSVELPWNPTSPYHFSDEYIKWMIRNEHWALMDFSLVKFADEPRRHTAIELLLGFLEERATDTNVQNMNFNAALFVASYLNHKALVRLSLENGADINAVSKADSTALVAASKYGHEGIARLLLEHGADVNIESHKHGTALKEASSNDHKEIARLLLENGADINFQGHGWTALQEAIEHGHEGMAVLLLEHGADFNVENKGTAATFQAASSRGYEKIVRWLLQNGKNVNSEDGHSRTALQAASHNGHEEITRLLLQNGANANAKGALQAASSIGHKEIVSLLLKNGANVNAEVERHGVSTALQTASKSGYAEIAKLLLEHGADVNFMGGDYGTALQAASQYGYEEIARLLLEHGADVNVQGGKYGSPLQAASKEGYEGIVRLLLKNGANVNAEGGYYGNALQAASAIDRDEMLRLLLKKGESLDNANKVSSYLGHKEIARLLLENGAHVNAEGGFHGTALQAASTVGRKEIVRLLLKNGAIASNKTMEAASDSGDEDVKKLIRNALKSQAKEEGRQ